MAIVISSSTFLTIFLKIILISFFGLCVISGAISFKTFVIEALVQKDIRPFYNITLFIVAPFLLILAKPTYWFSPLSLEVPYIFFYALFFIIFLMLSMLVMYFISLYWRIFKKKSSGSDIIDQYPLTGGTVLFICGILLAVAINFSFY